MLWEEKFGPSLVAMVVTWACLGLAAALEGRCGCRGSEGRDGAASGALLGLDLPERCLDDLVFEFSLAPGNCQCFCGPTALAELAGPEPG